MNERKGDVDARLLALRAATDAIGPEKGFAENVALRAAGVHSTGTLNVVARFSPWALRIAAVAAAAAFAVAWFGDRDLAAQADVLVDVAGVTP